MCYHSPKDQYPSEHQQCQDANHIHYARYKTLPIKVVADLWYEVKHTLGYSQQEYSREGRVDQEKLSVATIVFRRKHPCQNDAYQRLHNEAEALCRGEQACLLG